MFNTPAPEEAEEHVADYNENLGDFLKDARLSQGLNIATVASETRVNVKSLIALEENSRDGLSADVFNRGFVKIYAAYLKLDPQKAIRLYEKQWGSTMLTNPFAGPAKPRLGLGPGIVLSLLLAALFLVVRIYYPGGQDVTSPVAHSDEPGPAPPPAAAPTSNSPSAVPGSAETTTEPVHPPMDEAEISPAATGSQTQREPSLPTPPYDITLHSTEATTITLSLDGRQAVEQTLQAGGNQAWQATKEFALTLDRANGVTLTINGALVDIKAEAGQPVTIHRP